MCVIAISSPVRLYMNSIRPEVTPSQSSRSFNRPNFCSSTVHAAVRTRMEVQNGSSTSMIRREATVPGSVASSQASGKPSTSVMAVTAAAMRNVRRKIRR